MEVNEERNIHHAMHIKSSSSKSSERELIIHKLKHVIHVLGRRGMNVGIGLSRLRAK